MNEHGASSRLLAGLQAGMAGALVMLAWLAFATFWSRHSIWWFPNLMATTFRGDPALHTGFSRDSLAGVALHLIQFSALGALFGLLAPARIGYTRLLLLGLGSSLAFYYLMYHVVWKYMNPLIPLYSPDRQVIIGHIIYGLMLVRVRSYWSANVSATEYSGLS